jgi:hypothetical protein
LTHHQGWDRYENGKLIQGMKLRKGSSFESIIFKTSKENKKTTNVQVYELGQANHCASPRTISVRIILHS